MKKRILGCILLFLLGTGISFSQEKYQKTRSGTERVLVIDHGA